MAPMKVFSPESSLLLTHGKKIVQFKDDEANFLQAIDDISVKMRERALHDYGFVSG